MEEESKPELIRELTQAIDASGGLTFAEYMGQALYHPRYGYYTASRSRIGKQGDFFTTNHAMPADEFYTIAVPVQFEAKRYLLKIFIKEFNQHACDLR